MKTAIALIATALIVAAPVAAAIRPADQALARTLSLRLEDFDSGWRKAIASSNKVRRNTCPSAPKIQGSITGFNDAGRFRPVDVNAAPQDAESTTRVFASEAATKRWFNWAGGGKQAACIASGEVKARKDNGYAVSRPRVNRQSFHAACSPCPPHQIRAWSIRYKVAKAGDSFTVFEDWVVVRVDRAVIGFDFYDADHQFIGAESLVGSVLERAP